MKKSTLLCVSALALVLGLTFQPGCAMDMEETSKIIGLPPELQNEIISRCQGEKNFLNNISLVCKTWKKLSDEKTTWFGIKPGLTNEMFSLSFLIRFTNLTSLDLRRNEMITNDALSLLTNLTKLDLFNNNKITNSAISRLTNLTILNLHSNK